VRFADGVRRLAEEPARLLLEVGPGDSLTRLARRTLGASGSSPEGMAFASLPGGGDRPEAASLLDAAGHLWSAGARLDWPALHPEPRRRVPLPTYPFERRSYQLPRAAPELPAPATHDVPQETPAAPADAADGVEALIERQLALISRQLDLLAGATPPEPPEATR
jgi:acyl transferase domain-containing protein